MGNVNNISKQKKNPKANYVHPLKPEPFLYVHRDSVLMLEGHGIPDLVMFVMEIILFFPVWLHSNCFVSIYKV